MYNLTQEELANRVELTKGYISQLENDLTEPSISTLEDIVKALGTNLSDFFEEEKQEEQIVFKKDDYLKYENAGYTVTEYNETNDKATYERVRISKLF